MRRVRIASNRVKAVKYPENPRMKESSQAVKGTAQGGTETGGPKGSITGTPNTQSTGEG